LTPLDGSLEDLVTFSGYLNGLEEKSMVVGVETRRTRCEDPSRPFRAISGRKDMNTHMSSTADGHSLSPTQIRWLLLAVMGVFFASAAVIPSMGALLRQITGLLLP
jgi:hypothetical protein